MWARWDVRIIVQVDQLVRNNQLVGLLAFERLLDWRPELASHLWFLMSRSLAHGSSGWGVQRLDLCPDWPNQLVLWTADGGRRRQATCLPLAPNGIQNASGVRIALRELGVEPKDAVAVGGPEADLQVLAMCGSLRPWPTPRQLSKLKATSSHAKAMVPAALTASPA
jgi:hypothetical protein